MWVRIWKFIFRFYFVGKNSRSPSFWATVRQNRFTELGERSKRSFHDSSWWTKRCFALLNSRFTTCRGMKTCFASFYELREPILANSSAKWRASRVLSSKIKTKIKFSNFDQQFFEKLDFRTVFSEWSKLYFFEKLNHFDQDIDIIMMRHPESVFQLLKWFCTDFESDLSKIRCSPAIQTNPRLFAWVGIAYSKQCHNELSCCHCGNRWE